jgi:biopolymer transport protein ExbD
LLFNGASLVVVQDAERTYGSAKELSSHLSSSQSSAAANESLAMNEAQLQEALQSALAGRVDRTVYIRADRSLDFGEVTEAIGVAKQAAAGRIGVLTAQDLR